MLIALASKLQVVVNGELPTACSPIVQHTATATGHKGPDTLSLFSL